MVYGHYGSVPPSWVSGYADAFLQRYLDRSKPLSNSLFVAGLVVLSIQKFWQYNYRAPLAESWYLWRWLYPNPGWNCLRNPIRK